MFLNASILKKCKNLQTPNKLFLNESILVNCKNLKTPNKLFLNALILVKCKNLKTPNKLFLNASILEKCKNLQTPNKLFLNESILVNCKNLKTPNKLFLNALILVKCKNLQTPNKLFLNASILEKCKTLMGESKCFINIYLTPNVWTPFHGKDDGWMMNVYNNNESSPCYLETLERLFYLDARKLGNNIINIRHNHSQFHGGEKNKKKVSTNVFLLFHEKVTNSNNIENYIIRFCEELIIFQGLKVNHCCYIPNGIRMELNN